MRNARAAACLTAATAVFVWLGVGTIWAPTAYADLSFCEGLEDLEPEVLDAMRRDVRRAGRLTEMGIANGLGWYASADRKGPIYRLELSIGLTFAATRDLDEMCRRGHLPSATGFHFFAGTRNFQNLQAGGFLRYYNQLNISAMVPIWELGGGVDGDVNDPWAPMVRVGFGLGNPYVHVMLLSDIVVRDEVGANVTLMLRLDRSLLAFIF